MKSIFNHYIISVFLLSAILALAAGVTVARAQTTLNISSVNVANKTATSVTIQWTTNNEADALVNYGLNPNFGIERSAIQDETSHSVVLSDLLPSTTYYFRVVSSDQDGDRTLSSGFQFITEGLQDVPGLDQIIPEERPTVERTVTDLEEVTDSNALSIISDKVREMLRRIGAGPTIMGKPSVDPGETSAVISWETDIPSDSFVAIATENEFNPALEDPYSTSQGSSDMTTTHQVELVGLNPATTYHFQVRSRSAEGLVGQTEDDTFRTISPIPAPFNVSLDRVNRTSVTISWDVEVPAAGVVEFTNLDTGETRTKGNPALLTSHTMRLSELDFNARYSAIVMSENEEGERSSGETLNFETRVNMDPPEIENVDSDLTLYPGDDAKVQAILGWETDKPTFCDLHYQEGITEGADVRTVERKSEPVADHTMVVTAFSPATIYKYWVECEDIFGNVSASEDFVLLTPQKEKNIIDLILENFELAFGWVREIGM